jgi:beta-N-acetylhexosaminidase
MAADPMRHGLGELVLERSPGSEAIRLDEGVGDVSALARAADGKRIVLVVRDAHRHAWERSLAESLVALRPDTIVVDVGYPAERVQGAAGYLTTFGAGRANLVAAADRLFGD